MEMLFQSVHRVVVSQVVMSACRRQGAPNFSVGGLRNIFYTFCGFLKVSIGQKQAMHSTLLLLDWFQSPVYSCTKMSVFSQDVSHCVVLHRW